MRKLLWKLHYVRCELIYLLGGIPKGHINTTHYRNIGAIVGDISAKIKAANEYQHG